MFVWIGCSFMQTKGFKYILSKVVLWKEMELWSFEFNHSAFVLNALTKSAFFLKEKIDIGDVKTRGKSKR